MKIIKVFSESCGPCKVLEKNLAEAGIEHESVNVDSEEGDLIVDKYKIRAVPTLLIVDEEGDLLDKRVGILTIPQLKEFIGN